MISDVELITIKLLNSGQVMPKVFINGKFLEMIQKPSYKDAAQVIWNYRIKYNSSITEEAFNYEVSLQALDTTVQHEDSDILSDTFRSAIDLEISTGDTPEYWYDKLSFNYAALKMNKALGSALDKRDSGHIQEAADNLIVEMMGCLSVLKQGKQEETYTHIDAAESVWNDYINAVENPSKALGLQTGFTPFDESQPGLMKGDLLVLAARPNVGKSVSLNSIIVNAYTSGKTVVVSNIEMDPKFVNTRFISALTSIPAHGILSGNMSASDVDATRMDEQLRDSINIACESPGRVIFLPRSARTITELKSELKKLVDGAGVKIDVLVLDYLNLLEPDLSHRKGVQLAMHDIQKENVEQLRQIGIDFEFPIITACQISRKGSEIELDGREPDLEILAESDYIGRTADYVMWLRKNARDIELNTVSVVLLKSRNGQTMRFRMLHDGPCYYMSYASGITES